MQPQFSGVLAVRVCVSDFLNLELIRVGHYRLHLSCVSATGLQATPVSLQAAPQCLEAVSKGAACGDSPCPPLTAELDDAEGCFLSRSVHIRYTDEQHQMREAFTFHVPQVPLQPPDARLYVRLRLLRAEGAKPSDAAAAAAAAAAAPSAAAFVPVASRTLCLSTLAATRGLALHVPLLFERDYLAALGVSVHTGLLSAALAPLPAPRQLTAQELSASVEELARAPPPLPRPLPGSSAALFARAPPPLLAPHALQPAAAPPFWARRFLTHAAGRHTLREWVSPAHHRRAALARGEGVRALVAATMALAREAPPGGAGAAAAAAAAAAGPAVPTPAQLAAALRHFAGGLSAAAADTARAAAAEEAAAGGGAGEGGGSGGDAEAEELSQEALGHAKEALVLTLLRTEAALQEWRQEQLQEAVGAQQQQLPQWLAERQGGGAGDTPASASALSDVALDASGAFLRPQAHNSALEVAALLRAASQATQAVTRSWRDTFVALMRAPSEGTLAPLRSAFDSAARAASAACCSQHASAEAALLAPLQEELLRPHLHARDKAAAAAAAAAPPFHTAPCGRSFCPTLDSARHFLGTQWVRYSRPPAPPPPPPHTGTHLVVLVHGLGGNAHDMRGYAAALKLHHPRLLCHAAVSCAGESTGDILASGLRLGSEVAEVCREQQARVTRLSFVCFSLGGVWARIAVRAPALAPLRACLHALVTIASPHLGFPSDAKGSALLSTGTFFMSGWVGKKKTLALAQLGLQAPAAAGASAGASAEGAGGEQLPLLYHLACGWRAAAAAAAAGKAAGQPPLAEPLASLCASGLDAGPNGSAVLAHFKHVVLLGSPQDSYSPFHSAMAAAAGGSGGGGGGGGAALHSDMVRGFWEGAAGSQGGVELQRVSVHLADMAGGSAGGAASEAAMAEGCLGPPDAACAPAPASLAAQVGSGFMGVFDSLSGRDAHMALLTSEALPQVLALELPQAWV